ncbi:expressed unknown protein [Seminavis robusta]|uniref:Uncharacterized protein n=1 Tax=Seminavis robusta TaxID=568900 RepID=A0A9N8DPB5_9STRA|nr:expressed unknown protein [Seminavis robusta]|eukprot:Sro258_g101150.1 n/a (124) ;mRNA; f:61054-61425
MFGLGRYLYGLCDRIVTRVRELLVVPTGLPRDRGAGTDSTGNPRSASAPPMTAEQRQHEEQRKRVNADRFYSNGHLIETVQDESQSNFDEEAQQADNHKTMHEKPHPYQDKDRMTTLMEPIEE